jgi:Ala-tRNA(Pro) deacylase
MGIGSGKGYLATLSEPVQAKPVTDARLPSSRGPMPEPQDFSREPEKPLFARLDSLALPWINTRHAPVRTVEESSKVDKGIAGAHSKNLVLKDRKGALVLVSAGHDTQLPLNQLHRALGTQRLSFTDAQRLWDALGVTPGSVTGFALMNDPALQVRYVLDAGLWDHETWNFHPLRNDMTVSIAREDFLSFCRTTGHEPTRIDFRTLASPAGG